MSYAKSSELVCNEICGIGDLVFSLPWYVIHLLASHSHTKIRVRWYRNILGIYHKFFYRLVDSISIKVLCVSANTAIYHNLVPIVRQDVVLKLGHGGKIDNSIYCFSGILKLIPCWNITITWLSAMHQEQNDKTTTNIIEYVASNIFILFNCRYSYALPLTCVIIV